MPPTPTSRRAARGDLGRSPLVGQSVGVAVEPFAGGDLKVEASGGGGVCGVFFFFFWGGGGLGFGGEGCFHCLH